jgi:hypothetical protein
MTAVLERKARVLYRYWYKGNNSTSVCGSLCEELCDIDGQHVKGSKAKSRRHCWQEEL